MGKEVCGFCAGTGSVQVLRLRNDEDTDYEDGPCPRCQGTGWDRLPGLPDGLKALSEIAMKGVLNAISSGKLKKPGSP